MRSVMERGPMSRFKRRTMDDQKHGLEDFVTPSCANPKGVVSHGKKPLAGAERWTEPRARAGGLWKIDYNRFHPT